MTGRAQTILLVDDDRLVRAAVSRVLRVLGFETLQAADGKEALVLHDQHLDSIALVILDLYMPVMGGRETLEQLRKVAPTLPVLVTSGTNEAEIDLPEIGLDHTRYLQKPFLPDKLAEILFSMLAGSAAEPR